ncbi:hypothetical protein PTTW11_10060 [Pyrenophora teres f. teres]|uniref:Uncharacterized protein n=1 Tax=Pyrenophora teres f. teres TaxID=97479 RepID=A0A6S6WCL6_9PLEO|nr:hypothetical protein PTTW11_10060 [Pyrenophora teres f. teres]
MAAENQTDLALQTSAWCKDIKTAYKSSKKIWLVSFPNVMSVAVEMPPRLEGNVMYHNRFNVMPSDYFYQRL